MSDKWTGPPLTRLKKFQNQFDECLNKILASCPNFSNLAKLSAFSRNLKSFYSPSFQTFFDRCFCPFNFLSIVKTFTLTLHHADCTMVVFGFPSYFLYFQNDESSQCHLLLDFMWKY